MSALKIIGLAILFVGVVGLVVHRWVQSKADKITSEGEE